MSKRSKSRARRRLKTWRVARLLRRIAAATLYHGSMAREVGLLADAFATAAGQVRAFNESLPAVEANP